MNTRNIILRTIAFTIFTLGLTIAAQAQSSRTWVSGVGDDFNPCSRTAPCKTFSGAISKTATNGEINCLDPGGFGALTITKSITVDCHDMFAGVLNSGLSAFTVNFDQFAGTDTRKSVRIRNINGQGFNNGTNGVRIVGGAVVTGGTVIVEDCLFDGNFGVPGHGIVDNRTNGGDLVVKNTVVRNNGGSGMSIVPSSGSVRLNVTVDNCHFNNNNFGVAIGNGVRAQINNSTAMGNTNAGFLAEGPLAVGELNLSNSVSTSNGTGVQASAGGTVRLYNNDIAFNGAGISGATVSFGLNRISGNTAAGTAPTAAGAASSGLGTQ
jgi:hypothetical protein